MIQYCSFVELAIFSCFSFPLFTLVRYVLVTRSSHADAELLHRLNGMRSDILSWNHLGLLFSPCGVIEWGGIFIKDTVSCMHS